MVTNNRRRREKDPSIKPLEFRDLADESAMILNGGTEPPANQMAYATYHFLKYPKVQRRIIEELNSIDLDDRGRLPLQKIEQLPYFVRTDYKIIFHRDPSFQHSAPAVLQSHWDAGPSDRTTNLIYSLDLVCERKSTPRYPHPRPSASTDP
jgi:hypothetical protein